MVGYGWIVYLPGEVGQVGKVRYYGETLDSRHDPGNNNDIGGHGSSERVVRKVKEEEERCEKRETRKENEQARMASRQSQSELRLRRGGREGWRRPNLNQGTPTGYGPSAVSLCCAVSL